MSARTATTVKPVAIADQFDLSLIVCLYFEEECVEEFVRQVQSELKSTAMHWEIIFVDDGSRDRTVPIVSELAVKDPRIKLVVLSRNYGKEAAITAGIAYATGKVMILMDPDLQDPPDRILDFYTECMEGHDLVWGVRQQQSRGLIEQLFSALFWKTLRGMTGLPIPIDVAVMRSFSKRFADAFLLFPESCRFIEGVFASIGFDTTTLEVENRPRFAGKSKFNFSKRISLAAKAITAFSDRPLTITISAGAVGLLISLGFAIYMLCQKLFLNIGLNGWTSTIAAIVFMGSLNLITIGLTGLYVGRVYREVKGRPVYLVKDTWNLTKTDDMSAGGTLHE